MSVSSPSDYLSSQAAGGSLELAVIGFETAEGQTLINGLRNTGLAVHPHFTEQRNDLDTLLQQEAPHICLLKYDSDTIEQGYAVTRIQGKDPGVSLIFVAEDPVAALVAATACNARDVVHKTELDRLAFLLRREQLDLSQRHEIGRLAERLDETENRCRILIDTSRDAIAYVHAGMHVHANPVYAELFGYQQPSDLEDLPLMDLIAPDDRARFKQDVLRHLDDGDQCQSADVNCTAADGRRFRTSLDFCPAVVDGEPCTQIVIRDTAPHRALEEKIAELSSRDLQTGLYNRHFFMELLESTLSRTDALPQVLIKIGIVGFAKLRDQCGITKIDQLIKEIARLIDNVSGNSAVLSRFGEHDFLLLTDYTSEPRRTAETLLDALDNHVYELPEEVAQPDYAVGIAISNRPPTRSAHELVNRVLRAANHAEQSTSERLAFAHQLEGAHGPAVPDPEVIAMIDQALEQDGFHLYFQPIVSLQGDSREHYAVLVRLDGQSEQELLPEAFLSHAEQGQRLAEIDRWVIRNSLREIANLHEAGQKTIFFINISSAGIKDDSLLLWICDCLREFKAKGGWLTFQFNDTDLRENPVDAERLLKGLKTINCRISVNRYRDDPQRDNLFKQFPIDTVKIAPELTTRLASNQNLERLKNLNAQLHEMGLDTVATAVEDAASLAALWDIRLNYLQGFFLQHPADRILYDSSY